MTESTFSIKDADGVAHAYKVHLHPVQQGQVIMWQLYALGAEPLAGLVQAGLALLDGRSLRDIMDLDTDDLDLSGLGSAVKQALLTADMPALTQQLIAFVWRDGHPLKHPQHFDAAYRGNYGELIVLLWRVVEANRFLPLSAISSLVKAETPELQTAGAVPLSE